MGKKVRPIIKRKTKENRSFEDRHYRFTTYLEKRVRQKMKILKEENMIPSYKELVNDAIKHYIKEHL